ncbi:MAG: helix-turn-helix transcriptional regulator [Hyphomonadaceae bacterium]|nr:helix-turn-helix transcriptional regulator [Hyphomonadaceae bacterium]
MKNSLQVQIRGAPGSEPEATRITRAPFAAEHVILPRNTTYDFRWGGEAAYLAWHDIVLNDGAIQGDNIPLTHSLDLRRRLTFLPKGVRVQGFSEQADRVNAYTVLYFDQAWLLDQLEASSSEGDLSPLVHYLDLPLNATMEKLTQAVRSPNAAPRLLLDTLALLAGAELLGVFSSRRRAAGGLSAAQQTAAEDFIEAHFREDVGLAEIAAAAGLSPFHFTRGFKRATGTTPYRYVLERRVRYAKELMRDSDLSLGEIAITAGFKNASHFSRVFAELTGAPPRVYRQQLIN